MKAKAGTSDRLWLGLGREVWTLRRVNGRCVTLCESLLGGYTARCTNSPLNSGSRRSRPGFPRR
jgi:hypothetical protein